METRSSPCDTTGRSGSTIAKVWAIYGASSGHSWRAVRWPSRIVTSCWSPTKGNFERHLRLVETQRRCFGALGSLDPPLVEFVEAATVEGNVARVKHTVASAHGLAVADALGLFDALVDWLRGNEV